MWHWALTSLQGVLVQWCNTPLFFLFFLAFNFCRFCVVIRFFHPTTTANDLRLGRIYIPDLIHYIIFQYFPFQCWVLDKGTTGTIFLTCLVWRGPWLGIEPGTSRTRSQHSTTWLSRRRLYSFMSYYLCNRVGWRRFLTANSFIPGSMFGILCHNV